MCTQVFLPYNGVRLAFCNLHLPKAKNILTFNSILSNEKERESERLVGGRKENSNGALLVFPPTFQSKPA